MARSSPNRSTWRYSWISPPRTSTRSTRAPAPSARPVDDLRRQTRSNCSDTRISPAVRHQPAVPRSSVAGVTRNTGQTGRGNSFAWPAPTGRWGVARPCDLPAQHHQLVAQHGHLHVLSIWRRTQAHQTENTPNDHERHRANHHDRQLARVLPGHSPDPDLAPFTVSANHQHRPCDRVLARHRSTTPKLLRRLGNFLFDTVRPRSPSSLHDRHRSGSRAERNVRSSAQRHLEL